MGVSAFSAWVFLPFVLPICFYVAFTDLRDMRIRNHAVVALALIFLVVGLFALPFDVYKLRLLNLVIVLLCGILFNAAGLIGAGDAKFAAAAAPFFATQDLRLVLALLTACLLAAYATHRLIKHTALRKIAPDWQSWKRGLDFPMGLCLGGTLGMYLILATQLGS